MHAEALKEEPYSTEGSFNYYLPPPDGARAYKNINDRTDCNYIRDTKFVPVYNLRGKEDTKKLDIAGFQYYRHTSACIDEDFASKETVTTKYYNECIELIKGLYGASKVYIFDHTIRRHVPGISEESPDKRQPVTNVHVDQTAGSATARCYRHLSEAEAAELLKGRFQIMNIWRPISNPAYDWPLGLIDTSSVVPDRDLMPMTLKFPGGPGETYGVMYHPGHKWFYLRGMTPEEIVVFKCYDSLDKDGVCKFNGHSAFDDPTTPRGAPLRESIEIRALVFY